MNEFNEFNQEPIQEFFGKKNDDTKEFVKNKWYTSGDNSRKLREFKSSTISDKEYIRLKDVFEVLREETKDFAKYKRAFNSLSFPI